MGAGAERATAAAPDWHNNCAQRRIFSVELRGSEDERVLPSHSD